MKFLLVTIDYPPKFGGVANYYENLVKHFPKEDEIFVLDNIKNVLINSKLPFFKWLPSIWNIYKEIKAKKIDYILVGQILPLGTTVFLISKIARKPYSVFLHGMDFTFSLKSARKKSLAKKILKKAKNIICTNSFVSGLVKEFLGKEYEDKIFVVNPGVIISDFRFQILDFRKKNNLENKFVLLSIGRLVKRKGFDKVIEVMPDVIKEIPNLVYVILGDGEEAENFKFKILNLKLNDNIKLINNVSNEEKFNWLNICDMFIMPSRNIDGDFEGFGIVYLEANLLGKPVIAGDSGGVKDAVINGYNGILVNPEDNKEIKNAILKLSKDEKFREKLGEQGKERVINEFSWEKRTEKIYQIII